MTCNKIVSECLLLRNCKARAPLISIADNNLVLLVTVISTVEKCYATTTSTFFL